MTETPWERARRKKKPEHRRSEERLASGGGVLQFNSGRSWSSKRDVRKFSYLFENRLVESNKSYSIKVDELKKITRDAAFEQLLPAMRIEFKLYTEDWVLVRRGDFEDFHDHMHQLEGVIERLIYERDNAFGPDDDVS